MTKYILFLLLPFLFQTGSTDCKGIKEGRFNLESNDGSIHTIVRTKDTQTEKVGKTGVISEFDIKWTSDCSYLLFNRRVIEGEDSMIDVFEIDTLYNEVVEVNGKFHKVVSSTKRYDLQLESVLIKIDE